MISPSYFEKTIGRSKTAISGIKDTTGAVCETTMAMSPDCA